MPTENDRNSSLALLIDADNASPDIIDALLTEIAKLGTASVKRIYGDWTKPQLGPWKEKLLDHSIHPIQQFGYTKGKTATNSAMIIDAMDLLYTGNHSGFFVSSQATAISPDWHPASEKRAAKSTDLVSRRPPSPSSLPAIASSTLTYLKPQPSPKAARHQ